MIEIVRITGDRKPVLLGKNGSVKKRIEEATGTSIEVSGVVEISGEDPVSVLKAKEIVTAISRGFIPKKAMRLAEDDCELRIVSLEGETLKKRKRLFGRVIGRGGSSRKRIESETGASVCIKGKTVSIIGMPDEAGPAEAAVEELLSGKTHAWAYRKMYRGMES